MTGPALIGNTRQRPRQLRLFNLRDPLSVRFGADYFRELPAQPGVYLFYGSEGELLYIGQSSDLKTRIGSYRQVTPDKNPGRTLRLVSRITRIEWRTCITAADAVELERILLLEHRPPFNRAGVWQGDPWWLIVEARPGKIRLELGGEKNGTGPLPPGFRHVFGSLVRCLYRAAFPALPVSQYPHGLFNPVVPLTLNLSLPDIREAAELITGYATGNSAAILTMLETMPPASSLLEQEYWSEEVESLKRYAGKRRRFGPPGVNFTYPTSPGVLI